MGQKHQFDIHTYKWEWEDINGLPTQLRVHCCFLRQTFAPLHALPVHIQIIHARKNTEGGQIMFFD